MVTSRSTPLKRGKRGVLCDMKYHDNGCFYTVTVSAREVEDFASRWPCANLRHKSVWLQFDKRNGNLVDTNNTQNHPHADGGAILALCDDAKDYAQNLGIV